MYKKLNILEENNKNAHSTKSVQELATYYHDSVLSAMNDLRATADEIETLVGEKYWPYPTYGALLFYTV